jgi:4-alpha-glucanotransferase
VGIVEYMCNIICMRHAGTHDNETSVGWWTDSANKVDKEYFCQYLNTDGLDPAWTVIREAYKSVSKTSVFLMQVCRLPGREGGREKEGDSRDK